ncbi:MAG: type II toxin-antitoxin system RelE/ParE family toxin [Aliihoeflea sp.]|uniref:type II toxin-antitoxin system RelE/ParE family toxin n=1 Tax=Aliihoeflea sp. TaxID=2608088 RepID=UPI004034A03E
MKARLSPAALEDLDGILRFLASQSPSAAAGFRDKFKQIRQLLGVYPHGGRRTDQENLRYVNARPYPYLVFYDVIDGQAVIQRLIHGARNPLSMPGRPS